MNRKVIFDAYTFLRASTGDLERFQDECKAMDHLKQICDNVCWNIGIQREYERTMRNISMALIRPLLDDLTIRKKLWRVPSSVTPVGGLGNQHDIFVESALAGQAKFFVTKNPQWKKLSPALEQNGVKVVSPEEYLKVDK